MNVSTTKVRLVIFNWIFKMVFQNTGKCELRRFLLRQSHNVSEKGCYWGRSLCNPAISWSSMYLVEGVTLLVKNLTSIGTRATERGGATGAICPGLHSVRGPILINVTSIMQKCFKPYYSYPCMFILINKLHILTFPITGAFHSLLASSVIHQPPLDHLLNDNNF